MPAPLRRCRCRHRSGRGAPAQELRAALFSRRAFAATRAATGHGALFANALATSRSQHQSRKHAGVRRVIPVAETNLAGPSTRSMDAALRTAPVCLSDRATHEYLVQTASRRKHSARDIKSPTDKCDSAYFPPRFTAEAQSKQRFAERRIDLGTSRGDNPFSPPLSSLCESLLALCLCGESVISIDQNTSFKPNCTTRGSSVPVSAPKSAALKLVANVRKFALLKRLKTSARNCSFTFSAMRVRFISDRFQFCVLGISIRLRGVVAINPMRPANAAGLIQRSGDCPPGTARQSPTRSRLPAKPLLGEVEARLPPLTLTWRPLCHDVMPDNCQPPSAWPTKPCCLLKNGKS